MKKTIHINLGEVPFIIDDDAYLRLEGYIDSLNNIFSNDEAGDEIVKDIEVRFSEVLEEKLGNKKVVTIDDIDHCIATIGNPETFEQDRLQENYGSSTSEHYSRKRLYRDSDDKVIAGVCSGLSHYFGIQEPVWVRIVFALLLFMGLSPIIYILMWILVPSINLTGKPLGDETLGNVANTMKEEVVDVKNNFKKIFTKVSKKGYQL